MKRQLSLRSLVIASAATALIVGGCSGSDDSSGSTTSVGASVAPPTESTESTPATSTETSTSTDSTPAPEGSGEAITLTITSNSISGGKNTAEADWIMNYVIPTFQDQMAAEGRDVTVEFLPNGVDDEDYKTKISLDLSTEAGADLIAIDGIWFGEFADAGYIEPLDDVVGADVVSEWDGWDQITPAVQALTTYNDDRYGMPGGTDGRVIYFNKAIFEEAGLPADWQPTSWDDILTAARQIKESTDVIPIQWNAGSAMGEATTMQGALPLLVGTGEQIYSDGTWTGNTAGMQAVMEFYATVYGDEGLGDAVLQQEAQGRDQSFEQFANGEIAMLAEGDYFWRSVINPTDGIFPMADRDTNVGWAKIPAQQPGAGINGQDFVSMSGGGGQIINPNTAHPQEAWELMTFMASADAIKEQLAGSARITARDDVNAEVLADDPLLNFIATEVLPVTAYRPGLADYPAVSAAMQTATDDVVQGTSAGDATSSYSDAVAEIVGADMVNNGS